MTRISHVARIVSVLMVVAALSGCGKAAPARPANPNDALLDKVRVERSEAVLAGKDDVPDDALRMEVWGDDAELLWDRFCPYIHAFQSLRMEGWHETALRFRERLIAAASKNGLDAESLMRCLDAYAPHPDDNTAVVPVCAFTARCGDEPVWIIVYAWEIILHNEKINEQGHKVTTSIYSIGHVRVRALRMKDAKQIAFVTCN